MFGGDAVELKTIVGFTTTLPPLAQHENVDIRATHYQKVQQALHSPQYALDSKHGSYHTEPQTPVHPHTCINNNTATRTNCCPKNATRHFSSHATLSHQTEHMHVLVGRKRQPMPKFCQTGVPKGECIHSFTMTVCHHSQCHL